jgi:hypothetical protein
MKRVIFLGWLVLFLPAMVFAQEKVEAPVWNVGDKWVFTNNGIIEVLSVDQYGYVVKFSDDICVTERQGFNTIIFDKATMQRIYSLKGGKRTKYTKGKRNILNFPFTARKQWENAYCAKPVIATLSYLPSLDYYEKFKILGREEIGVHAGKFRALKIEAITGHHAMLPMIPSFEGKSFYWYSPDVKYFVKCKYDPGSIQLAPGEIVNWELTSLSLKK